MIRDIFHLYLFASPLKFSVSFGDAGLLPAPQNKAYVAQGYFTLLSPVSSTQEQQLPLQPLPGAAQRSQSQSLHGVSGQWSHRGDMELLGAALYRITQKRQKEGLEQAFVTLDQTHLWLYLFL